MPRTRLSSFNFEIARKTDTITTVIATNEFNLLFSAFASISIDIYLSLTKERRLPRSR